MRLRRSSSPESGLARRASSALLASGVGPAAGLAAGPALADGSNRPMYYLETFGSPGNEIAPLTLGLLWLATAVVVIVALLVLGGVLFRGRRVPDMRADYTAVQRPHDKRALRWVYGGLVVTVGSLQVDASLKRKLQQLDVAMRGLG